MKTTLVKEYRQLISTFVFSALGQQVGKQLPMNTVQIIQQPPGQPGQNVTYQLQQVLKRNTSGGMIIASQPTIIATVTQSQSSGGQQLITKVISTSATPMTHLQSQTLTPTNAPTTSNPSIMSGSPLLTLPSHTTVKAQTVATAVAHDVTTTLTQVHPVLTKVQAIPQQPVVTSQAMQQIHVAPTTPHQQHQPPPNVVVSSISSTPQPVTVTMASSLQSSAITATILQHATPTTPQHVVTASLGATTTPTPVIVSTTPGQAVVSTSTPTVTSQAALLAASAFPRGPETPPIPGVAVTQQQQTTQAQQQQQQQQQGKQSAPYAMRTRTKHT